MLLTKRRKEKQMRQTTTITMDHELHQEFKRFCFMKNKTMSEVIKELVTQAMAESKQEER